MTLLPATALLPSKNTKIDSHAICPSISSFCRKFSRLAKVQNAAQEGIEANHVRSCFTAYMDILRDKVIKRVESTDIVEDVLQGLEDHISRTIHGDIVATWASAVDLAMWKTVEKLRDSEADLEAILELPCRIEREILEKAGEMLDQLPDYMTPHEKLTLISDFTSLIFTELQFSHSLSHDSNPEMCLRVLAHALVRYLMARTGPAPLHSSLAFIYTFGTYRQPSLRETFSFSRFQAALNYIDRL